MRYGTRMLKVLVTLLATSLPAYADQFDYVLGFADQATAAADAQASGHWNAGTAAWASDHAMPVVIKRISTGVPIVGFFVLISIDRVVPALRDHTALKIVIDRDRCIARQTGCVVRSTVGGVILQDMTINPVFMGSDLPWGGFN